MQCEICGSESSSVLVILPIKKRGGCLNTIACPECARKSSAYCVKHEIAHLGFADDDTTACPRCIEDIVRNTESNVEYLYCDRLRIELPNKESTRLWQWAREVSQKIAQLEETCILRALATKALRTGKTVKEIIDQLIADQLVAAILPLGYE